MPEPKEGETRDDFVSRCIPIVLDDGTAEGQEQAVAVCNSMWEQAKKSADVEPEDEQIVYFGDAVKALGDGKLGGYLVRFSSDDDPDMVGEYFDRETDFGDAEAATVYYNHGLDPVLKRRKLSKAELRQDDFGIWAEAQLQLRDEYEKFIYQMAQDGKMGWSSGTASHLVEREQKGNAVWLKSWPLGLDASLTPTPAEPRNGVLPLKSLDVTPLKATEPMDAPPAEAGAQDGNAEPEADNPPPTKGIETPEGTPMTLEFTEEKLQEMLNSAADAGAEKALKALPAVQTDVKVIKDAADQDWKSAGEFFQAVKTAGIYPNAEDVRLRALKATGLGEGVPADGGYLLAPQYAGGLIERMYNVGRLLPLVANDPLGPNANTMVYNAINETSRAAGSRYGGVRGYWTAEAAAITASKPTFREMRLTLKKVAALCYATDELLADATALESWLYRTVPEELRFLVEDSFINGTGAGMPLGVLNAGCLVGVTRVDANQIDQDDIAKMWARRWAGVNDYVWLANQSIFPQLINLTVGNFPFLLPMNAGGQASPTFSLYGRPFIEVEYTKALGTQGDLILFSPSQYQTITKGGIQAASSIHVNFIYDESVFRFTYRVDGQPLWHSALTPFDAGNTLSPFVTLTAAST